jgi:hypothetical protein
MKGTLLLALGVTLLLVIGIEAAAQDTEVIEHGKVRLANENEKIVCAEMFDGESLKMMTF